MPTRNATARWEGDLPSGRGTMMFGSGAFEGQFSAASRFEEGVGTNPEELIAAAQAGCFSMALANIIAKAGYEPKSIQTEAQVKIERVDGGFGITHIQINTRAEIPGISEEEFRQHAETAKENCPVSKALKAVAKDVNATLVS